jgi:muconolactone delta-isomerase
MSTFLVDITLVDSFSSNFINQIPQQRKRINDLMNTSVVISYSLSMDRGKLWVVMEAKSEQEVMDVLSTFPLIKFMKPDINELAFHDNIHSGFPHLSLN